MAKPITGQYECVHSSGVGLDYFTSRVDRLILQPSGRFTLIVQEQSRISNAAKSLINGQQVAINAPETRKEGGYTLQGNLLSFRYDDGAQEQAQVSWNGEGLQYGANFFNKVSDSTLLPPTHRLKKDMDDIAKGLKIASTLGGMAMKAAKTIHDVVQTTQEPTGAGQTQAPQPTPAPRQQASPADQAEAVFCDQCGVRARPGKRFCNNCGAELP
jgi:hypothetical protein